MPAKPACAAMQGTSRKKAARVCQSRSFRKVIMVGSRKSLLSLHGTNSESNLRCKSRALTTTQDNIKHRHLVKLMTFLPVELSPLIQALP